MRKILPLKKLELDFDVDNKVHIAKGGQGSIYKAKNLKDGKYYALKYIESNFFDEFTDALQEGFANLRIIEHHPNVNTILSLYSGNFTKKFLTK